MDHGRNPSMTAFPKGLIVAGILIGALLTLLGLLAHWWPALDMLNNGLPIVAAAAVLLFGLAANTRDWRLIVPAALVAAINVVLLLASWQGAAAEAARRCRG